MNVRNLFNRFAIAIYFILAYTISWGGSFVVAGPKYLRGEALILSDVMRMFPLILAGPCIAGLLMTYLIDGTQGLRDLLRRAGKIRVGVRWYAAALLIFPVLISAVLLTMTALISPDFAPNFIAFGIIVGLFAGFFEELGWMGFAYPKMQVKHGTLRAILYLGLLHGLWHVMPALGDFRSYAGYWLPRFIVMWIVAMTAMRVILVWVYANTGSLILAQLTHASSSGFLVILGPSPITPANETLWWSIYAGALWLAAGAIIAKYGKNLMAEPKQTEMVQASAEGRSSL